MLWSPYRTLREAVADFRATDSPSVLEEIEQPNIGRVISARSPLRTNGAYGRAGRAPRLGEHTDELLAEVLGLSSREIAGLHDRGVVHQS